MVEDTVDVEVIAARARDELYGVKRLYRKGKAHPLLDIFLKAIAQLRENRKAIGLKRLARDLPNLAQALQAEVGKEVVCGRQDNRS